jgi:hypothetical protein
LLAASATLRPAKETFFQFNCADLCHCHIHVGQLGPVVDGPKFVFPFSSFVYSLANFGEVDLLPSVSAIVGGKL